MAKYGNGYMDGKAEVPEHIQTAEKRLAGYTHVKVFAPGISA